MYGSKFSLPSAAFRSATSRRFTSSPDRSARNLISRSACRFATVSSIRRISIGSPPLPPSPPPPPPQLDQPLCLPLCDGLVNSQNLNRLAFHRVLIHADDNLFLPVHRHLIPVRRLGNLPLRVRALDGRHHPAQRVNPLDVLPRA